VSKFLTPTRPRLVRIMIFDEDVFEREATVKESRHSANCWMAISETTPLYGPAPFLPMCAVASTGESAPLYADNYRGNYADQPGSAGRSARSYAGIRRYGRCD